MVIGTTKRFAVLKLQTPTKPQLTLTIEVIRLHLLLLVAALLIIIVLCGVAVYYLIQVNKQKKKQAEALLSIEKQANEKYQKIRQDIVFIAKAYLSDQVELPEASLRISKLVDLVIDERESREIYSVFDGIADEISNIPTHQGWKDLSRQERRDHSKKMQDLTELHRDAAKYAAKQIIQQEKTVH